MIKKIGCAIVGGFALYGLAKLVQETQERLSLTPEAYRLIYETDEDASDVMRLDDGQPAGEAASITALNDGDDVADSCAYGAEGQDEIGHGGTVNMPCM